MRRIISAVITVFFVALSIAPALAGNRQIVYPSQNPSSTETNGQARFTRLAFGTWIRDALGPTLSAGGVYNDLSASPNGGMFVAVGPTQANTLGALYQLAADDPNPLPQGVYTPQLSADTTKIIVQALQSSPSGSIGPLSAPASGNSQYYLIEAQVQTVDTTPLPMTFLNGSGTPSTLTVNTVRADQIVYQAKAGVAAPSNPAVPSVDSGWIGIATVLIPSGTATITSGMIAALPAFSGFVASGSNVTVSGLTISSLTTAGCLQNTTSGGVISSPCTSGLGSVVGTNPITATTSAGVATVGCTICVTSVNGSSNIASTGGTTPSISLTGTVPFGNLPATVAQTNVNNNFSVSQTTAGLADSALTASTCVGADASKSLVPSNCVASLTAGTGVSVGTGATPTVGLSHGDYADLTSAQTIGGAKTFSSVLTANAGVSVGTSQPYQINGNSILVSDGTNTALAVRMPSATGPINFQTGGGSPTTVSSITSSGTYTVGSSAYGPTSATVNGAINSATSTYLANGAFLLYQDGYTHLYAPTSGLFDFKVGGTSVSAIQGTGAYQVGSSTYGPTSATVNGTLTASILKGTCISPCAALQVGTTNSAGVIALSNAAPSSGTTYMGADPAKSFGNVSGDTFYVGAGGYNTGAAIDTQGDGGFTGAVNAGSYISVLNGAAFRVTQGSSPGTNGDFMAGLVGVEGSPYVGCAGTAQACTLYFYTNGTGSAYTARIDGTGTMYAAGYYTTSLRKWKKNIESYRFDPLTLLGRVDFKEYDCKDPHCGPDGMHKVGIIANDSPSQISGKKHDHYDAFALAAIDGAAIVELHRQVLILTGLVIGLGAWCLILTIVVARRRA